MPLSPDASTSAKASPPLLPSKKTRLPKSCDACRRKKIKCDSSTSVDGQCRNCREGGIVCSHDIPVQKRGIKNYSRQVTVLQERVKELEDLLIRAREQTSSNIVDPLSVGSSPQEDSQNDGQEHETLVDEMKRLNINGPGIADRYFGPSSNIHFVWQMMILKGEQALNTTPSEVEDYNVLTMHSWEAKSIVHPNFMFPPEDLLEDLINLYFIYLPVYMTLLHQPTFRRDVASGLHHLDPSFGAVVLMVCAVASRASSDPRVFLEGEPDAVQSAGWKWYSQTMTPPRSLFENPSIYDVQFCVLASQYLLGTSAPQATWTMIGLAARYATELGLHRHRPGPPTIESEIKKRVFWSVYIVDRHCSLYQGRPFLIRDEDFDVEYPFPCDDKYWDTGNPAADFQQPPGEPSQMEAFGQYIKLCHIISFMMRTLYGIRKSQEAAGLKGSWIENTVAVIDSMLNSWYNGLPSRLRWDPQAQPGEWFQHSAKLYMVYYDLQIHVHRPFVHKASPLALPSLAICTNAARSCIRLVEILLATGPVLSLIPNMAIFSAGTIIIMNMWHTVRTRPGQPPLQKDGEDLCRCMNVLQQGATQYRMCHRLMLSLRELSKGLPIPETCRPYMSPDVFNAAPSGYVSAPSATFDISILDPTLFGMQRKPTEAGSEGSSRLGYSPADADMSLFEEDDVMMWMNSLPATEPMASSWTDWNEYAATGFYDGGKRTLY